MPNYEYRCKKCGKRFEMRQKMEERGKSVCPFCHSDDVEKLFSLFGVGTSGSSGEADASPCGPENCVCGKYGGDN